MKHSLKRSFARALIGFKVGFVEANFRRHLVSAVVTLGLGFYYKLPQIEFVIVILCICLVLSAELANTAIERLASGHKNPRAALDVSASAVLMISAGSFIVGLIILIPHAWDNPWLLIAGIIIIPTLWVIMERNVRK